MIRLGVIGTGAVMQRHHWPALQTMPREIQVYAVASRNPDNARRFARQSGASRVYEDYRRLLEDREVDAVLTAVPIDLNGPVLLDALRAGKHVLAEKPLAATPQEGRQILQECSRRRGVVLIGENFRYRNDLSKARQLIAAGKIGRVFGFQVDVKYDVDTKERRIWISRNWRKEARHPGGFLLDAGVHPVAALRDMLGEVAEVYADVSDISSVMKGPDNLVMQLRLSSGAVGHCFFSYTAKQQFERELDFVIYGTRGSVRVGDLRVTWSRGVGLRPRVYAIRPFNSYVGQFRNFCRAILQKERVISTPEKAFGDLLVIDAALRSAKAGRKVSLA